MSDKQPIDKLFKDKLSDFEATPSASVWDSVSQQLNQGGNDRKAIPMWMKIAGIAAGIILLITVGNAFLGSDSDTVPQQEVVDSEENSVNPENEQNTVPTNAQDQNLPAEDETEDYDQANPGEVADSEIPDTSNEVEKNETSVQNKSTIQNAVAGTEPELENNNTPNVTDQNANDQLANNKVSNKPDEIPLNKDTEVAETIDQQKQGNQVKDTEEQQTELMDKINTEKDPVQNTVKETEDALAEVQSEENNDQEETTEDANEDLEEAIAAQEDGDSDEKEEFGNRWGVTPQLAPVYFNSLGSGSAIDDEFAGNSKSGEINMNYGIVASYDFNEKLTLRAGVNQMNVSYRTNDVIVYNNIQPAVDEKPLKNVNLNAASSDLSFISANGLNVAQVPGVVAANIESSIDQEIGFIEIPLELEYKLTDNKVGFSIIGGMSTLILNENKIYSNLQGNRTELGEASNINSTSFSANLGVGMNVKFSERIDLNLEPVFKYQLNTFKDASGNFNPYALGIYTGLSFKF